MNHREALGVSAKAETVEVDGVRLAVVREGAGPAVVCLHAIGHGGRDYEPFATLVKDRFQVVRLDWPGQGRSGPDRQPSSAARYAELLAVVLQRLNIEQPILVGNSIGGAAALLYAQKHGVRGLVLCNSGGLFPVTASVRRACTWFSRFFGAGARGARWFKFAFWAYYRFLVLPTPAAAAQRRRIVLAGYEAAPLLAEAWAGFGRPEADIRHIAESLDVPVWCAWAINDKLVSLRSARPCIERMSHAHISEFKGGHAAFLEQPQAFAEGFATFADSLP